MKKIFAITIISLALFSCSKNDANNLASEKDSAKIIDSINAAREKINDDIRKKNAQNRFKDFSGTHVFTHNMIGSAGKITFTKGDSRDFYSVTGSVGSGKNYVKINGEALAVGDNFFNFTGTVEQGIADYDNGKPYIRKGTKTFASKDGGKTYILQDKVNGSGFVDYITMKF